MLQDPVLIVEDSVSFSELIKSYLEAIGWPSIQFGSLEQTRAWLVDNKPKAIILDLRLPDGDGLDLLRSLPDPKNDYPIIVMTAHASVDRAVAAIQLGAVDFIEKPFAANRLLTTLGNAIEKSRLNQIVLNIQEQSRPTFCDMIGASPAMQAVYKSIESAARTDAPVFITGESGTGKELCASAIHQLSKRHAHNLVPLNCAAIPTDLMESEIFGYRKGAFSGAIRDSQGAAGEAHKGTLFLDELLEMDFDLQAKLLRFTQTGSYRPLGASTSMEADLRFISASNKSAHKEMQEGRFREDLFFRLHVLPISLPPLRERENDVVQLGEHFLDYYAKRFGRDLEGFTDSAKDRLLSYRWPGNVRELQNFVQQIVAVAEEGPVSAEALPSFMTEEKTENRVTEPSPHNLPSKRRAIRPLLQIEREVIEDAISQCHGNVAQAAAYLEISPSTIYRKKAQWER